MATCIRSIGLFGLLLWQAPAMGQSQWTTAGVPGQIVGLLRQVYANESRDAVYFAGSISFTGPQYWAESNSVMRYSNGQWDTLGVLNGLVYSVVLFNDTLIAAGQFFQCSGTPCQGIAYHNGVVWQPYGNIEGGIIRKLRVLDGELYAVGGFNLADGHPAPGVARRIGGSWEPVGSFSPQGSILDIIKYSGNLVVIGGVNIEGITDIAQWDGENWSPLGPGIVNPMSGAHCLAVYQGDLYVGGQIAIAPGNPGQNIMRWDGTQFHALGQGVQWWLGNTTSIASVLALAEHDGKLFVGGGYRAAGGIEALGLATWDGNEWCAVPGDFRASGGIWSMDFYHDTLFVACGAVLDGDSVNRAAKFIGEEYETECSEPVGFDVHYNDRESSFTLHPNPTSGLLHVALYGLRPREVFVADAVGRLVLQQALPATAQGPLQLDLGTVSTGVYLVTLLDAQGMRHVQRVVRE